MSSEVQFSARVKSVKIRSQDEDRKICDVVFQADLSDVAGVISSTAEGLVEEIDSGRLTNAVFSMEKLIVQAKIRSLVGQHTFNDFFGKTGKGYKDREGFVIADLVFSMPYRDEDLTFLAKSLGTNVDVVLASKQLEIMAARTFKKAASA